MKTSIVIPCYNHYDLLHQLLWDLYKHCRDSIDEVVVVDDASTEDIQKGLLGFWFKQGLLPLKVITNKENLGFLKTSNRGMEKASGDILILISTDVRIYNSFVIDRIKEIYSDSPDDILLGNRYISFDTGWNKFDRIYPYLEGWFIVCSKNTWNELGGFDERYAPNDYEDIDLSTLAIEKGLRIESLESSDIAHIGAQTYGYNPERSNHKDK